jgi:hypothetical protein
MEIIPKPKRRVIDLGKLFLYFSIFIFLFSVLMSVYFYYVEKKEMLKLQAVEEKISNLRTPEVKEKEEYILKLQRKIYLFSQLIQDYFFPSKFFPYLEGKIHKKIFLSGINLDFENLKFTISGTAPDFSTLYQQLEIFRQDPYLKADLKDIYLGREERVNFTFEIKFEKNILK